MKRNIDQLESQSFDVVVIGAGIYGAAITRSLVLAGYRTALIEKGDFGQATSANSLKILHGGFRYLQHLNLKRMRESITCRRELMQFSPHLAQPQSCLMPTSGYTLRNKGLMAAALFLNDLISSDRNRGLPRRLRLPRGTTLGKDQCTKILPGLDQQEITGAANWFDGLCNNTERLVLEHLLDADDFGACLANYVQADRITTVNNRVTGVHATDRNTGQRLQITTRLIINAAGPWFSELLHRSGIAAHAVSWAKAVNIVVKKQLHGKHAIGLEGSEAYIDKDAVFNRGKRLYFFVPWQKYTMIGTTYEYFPGSPDSLRVSRRDISKIIDDIHQIYPRYQLGLEDVTFVHCGLVPMSNSPTDPADNIQLEKNSLIIDHEQEDRCAGLISVKGVKYTTAPDAARKIVQLVQQKLALPDGGRRGRTREQTGGAPDSGGDTALQQRYGRFAGRVLPYTREREGAIPLGSSRLAILSGEILYFIREEMAVNLSDVIFRRSALGSAECPSEELLRQICAVMAEELGWDLEEQARQLQAVQAVFAPLLSTSPAQGR